MVAVLVFLLFFFIGIAVACGCFWCAAAALEETPVGAGIFVAVGIAMVVLFNWLGTSLATEFDKMDKCEDAGYVWLEQQSKCITQITEAPIDLD